MRPAVTIAGIVTILLLGGAVAVVASGRRGDDRFAQPWQQMAQETGRQTKAAPAKPAPKAAPQLQNLPVSLQQALYLIRSALLTLNDANRSGNYSVLHDLAAPNFQAKNTPADLARIFTDLRERHVDLFEAA